MPTEQKTAPGKSSFTFYSHGVKAYTQKAAAGAPDTMIVEGIASSNVRDRHGDTITTQAQAQMLAQAKGLTMFRNHSYDVPDDVFGTCIDAKLETAGDVVDLVISVAVDQTNEAAVKAWQSVNGGTKLAFSIGGIITNAEIDEENDDGSSWFPPLIINGIELLEISLVGIPANPRSYTRSFVEDMVRGSVRNASRQDAVKSAMLKSIGVADVSTEFADLRDAEIVNAAVAKAAGAIETAVDPELQKMRGAEKDRVIEALGHIQDAMTHGACNDATMHMKNAQMCLESMLPSEDIPDGDPDETQASGADIVAVASTKAAILDLKEHETRKAELDAEITSFLDRKATLETSINELEEKLAKLKATPTGRLGVALSGGSSTPAAAVDLAKMTQAELDAHLRKIVSGHGATDARSTMT